MKWGREYLLVLIKRTVNGTRLSACALVSLNPLDTTETLLIGLRVLCNSPTTSPDGDAMVAA
jgi:hypothetical protein